MASPVAKSARPALEARLLDSLDQREPAREPTWLLARRREAARRLRESGLPGPHDEAWRFTAVRDLVRLEVDPVDADTAHVDAEWIFEHLPPEGEVYRVALEAGHRVEAIQDALPAGVTARSFDEVMQENPAALEGRLGALAGDEGPFAAANTALFDDGLVLEIGKDVVVDRPIDIAHVAVEGLAHPRVLVLAGEGSEATVVETFVGHDDEGYLVNAVTEVFVAPEAHLEHLRVQEEGNEGYELATLAVRVDRGGVYRSRVISLGARIARLDLGVRLVGEGAECDLDGLYLGGGRQELVHHTLIEHVSPRTTSRESYKGILDGHAHGVFDGTIIVHKDAQGTSGSQENRNVLLSDNALVHTKPHLRIDADDVKCSHGATVGQLDEDQLFYLRARGLDGATARGVLIYAFAREIIDRIGVDSLRAHLGDAVLARLPSGLRIRELV